MLWSPDVALHQRSTLGANTRLRSMTGLGAGGTVPSLVEGGEPIAASLMTRRGRHQRPAIDAARASAYKPHDPVGGRRVALDRGKESGA